MMTSPSDRNRIRERRLSLSLTQAQLADRAGISRTAVTAMEGDQLVPSVAAALAVAEALGTTVEELFGRTSTETGTEVWAWKPSSPSIGHWRASVAGKIVHYPVASPAMLTPIPDGFIAGNTVAPQDTLVLAGCDPAAGWLASQFAATTGLRLLVLPRSSRQSLEMLKNGLVHIAGMHFSTKDDPERNTNIARETLGPGYTMVRIARWQEGITLSPSKRLRSVGAVKRARLSWIGREPGSGARQCLDQLLDNRPAPRRIARHHRGVVEAVASGWADAGVCVQLVSAEANLDFLPVQEEAYDVCFPTTLADDRRVKAFLNVVRSTTYRKLLGSLPGYHTGETGYVWYVD